MVPARFSGSFSNRIKQAHQAFEFQSLKAGEPRLPDEFFQAGGSHAGSQAWTALREGLRHAVKHAEAVVHGRNRVQVVLQPVCRLRFDDEQGALRFQECMNFLQRGNRF